MKENDYTSVVGDRIRFFRQKLGISQEELAFRTGVHRTYISDIERGIKNASFYIIIKIAHELYVSPVDFVHDNFPEFNPAFIVMDTDSEDEYSTNNDIDEL